MFSQILPHSSNRKDIKELALCVSIENIIRLGISGPAGAIALNISQQLKEQSPAPADFTIPFDFYFFPPIPFDCRKIYIFLPIGRV